MKAPQLVMNEKEIHVIAVGMQGPPGSGGSGGVTLESVSVWNNGDPQLVFTKTGDVVTNAT